jgi:polysaccharide deacetylase family protein (PEP-CTERM system associated)
MAITFTFDLEDSRTDLTRPVRFPAMTEQVLAFLEERGIHGTMFVVGEIADSHPELLRAVVAAGHEIALHGYHHVPLDMLDATTFAADLERGRAVLEDASGAEVTGYRAPIFSLTPHTAWGVDVLTAAGFRYSSSVLPATNPLNGWPGAPGRPFRWSTGLLELPCPVAGRGRLAVPFLGGVYLRYLPRRVVERLAARVAHDGAGWIYCHPYDFDTEEDFDVLPQASVLTSRILHHRRGDTFRRVAGVLDAGGGAGEPLGVIAERLATETSLPVLDAAPSPSGNTVIP